MSVISYDISDGYVWVVSSKHQGFPVFLSVHTDKGNAWEAVLEYVEGGEFGKHTADYSVIYRKLNQQCLFEREA